MHTTDTDTDIDTASIAARLAGIREGMMGGRGQGASTNEVLASTRNRVDIGGMTATRRLELGARQTSRARGDADAITTVIQLREAEVDCGVNDATGRLPRRLPTRGPRTSPTTSGNGSSAKASTAKGVLGVLAVWVLRRGPRH